MKTFSDRSHNLYSPEDKENNIGQDMNINRKYEMLKSSEIKPGDILKGSPDSFKFKSIDFTPDTKNAYGCEFASILRHDDLETTEKWNNRFKEWFPSDVYRNLSPVVKMPESPERDESSRGTDSLLSSQVIINANTKSGITQYTLDHEEWNMEFTWSHHNKKIEAFCNEWKDTLWIDWILSDKHKQHEFTSLEKAAKKQKDLIEANISKVLATKKTLERMESRVDKYVKDLDDRVKSNTKTIEEIYDLVITTITKKKQDSIASMMEVQEKETKISNEK